MTCPAPERLAEAATIGDAEILAHAATCARCAAAVEDQQAIRALVGGISQAPLTRAHRETLAAEILAHADQLPGPRSRRWIALIAVGVAVAAIATLVVYLPGRGAGDPQVIVTPSPPPPAPTVRVVPHEPAVIGPAESIVRPAPAPVAKARLGGTGQFAHEARSERDIVTLSAGELTVDAVGTRAVSVVNGDTAVGVRGARVQVVVKRGVIAQVSVFAGSAEVTVAGKRVVIEAGMTWDRNAAREDSLAAFRTGWEALRAGHNTEAIAAFELATDEVVAEDALYWSAIASERDHDAAGAVHHYRMLLDRFPRSPRAAAATTAIARLEP